MCSLATLLNSSESLPACTAAAPPLVCMQHHAGLFAWSWHSMRGAPALHSLSALGLARCSARCPLVAVVLPDLLAFCFAVFHWPHYPAVTLCHIGNCALFCAQTRCLLSLSAALAKRNCVNGAAVNVE